MAAAVFCEAGGGGGGRESSIKLTLEDLENWGLSIRSAHIGAWLELVTEMLFTSSLKQTVLILDHDAVELFVWIGLSAELSLTSRGDLLKESLVGSINLARLRLTGSVTVFS